MTFFPLILTSTPSLLTEPVDSLSNSFQTHILNRIYTATTLFLATISPHQPPTALARYSFLFQAVSEEKSFSP